MKTLMFATTILLASTAAFAQTPVLTNADLGKPVKQRFTMTPTQWQSFVDRQFKYVQPVPSHHGPRVAVTSWVAPTEELIRRSNEPVPGFYMNTYLGSPYFYPSPGFPLVLQQPIRHMGRRK
jgi:hypothetical protein